MEVRTYWQELELGKRLLLDEANTIRGGHTLTFGHTQYESKPHTVDGLLLPVSVSQESFSLSLPSLTHGCNYETHT